MAIEKKQVIIRGFRLTQIGIAGFWLLALYPILLWAVVGTLSGYGFQDKVELSKNSENGSFTVPAIVRLAEQLEGIKLRESLLKLELTKDNSDYNEEKNSLSLAKNKLLEWQYEDAKLNREITPRLKYLNTQSGIENSDRFDFEEIIIGLAVHSKDQKIVLLAPKFRELVAKQTNAQLGIIQAENTKEIALEKLVETERKIKKNKEQELAFLKSPSIGDLVTELEYMNALWFKKFATMPSQLLTLILTLSMGALGSVIFITLDFFLVGPEKPFSWYLFRPFLGMVTAVAVFILAKAGQLTISDASASQSISENLNPFFISFLGIISGLLSEQAAERIRSAGQAIFKTDTDSEKESKRWAVGFRAEMKKQNKSFKDLMPFVDASEATVQKWESENLTVPAEDQRIIAAWLGVSTRSLFTDIQPTTTAEEPQ